MSPANRQNAFDSVSATLRQIQPLLGKITQASNLDELCLATCEVLKNDFNFQSTGFYFINPQNQKLELVLGLNLTEEEKRDAESTAMNRHPGWVIRNKKTFLNNHDELKTDFHKRLHLVSRLFCPVIFKDECIGTIGVASSEENAFNDNHVAFIEFLCQIVAVAYENIAHVDALELATERMNHAIEAVKFGIWDWDIQKNILIWDLTMYRLFGVDPTEFSGAYDAFGKLLHPEDADRVTRELEETFRSRKDFHSEFRVKTSYGIRRIAAHAKCVLTETGTVARLVGANWDVTEARENEIKLLQASKMSSLGEMSSGIAHEINNPLSILLGKSHQIRKIASKAGTESAPLIKLTSDLDSTIERIAKIVKGLRNFSRDGAGDPFEGKQVKELLEETLSFCSSRFKNHDIEILVPVIPDTLQLECRPTQISQVLLNLLNNAFDAVHERSGSKWIRIEIADRGADVEIAITDSGHGIPETVRAKILEPFFTTKEVGKGTGLGLSISLGIIKAHNGQFFLDQESKNTRFVIQLPKKQP